MVDGDDRLKLTQRGPGMMDNTQDLTEMYEQMCEVTAGRRVHKPPSYDQHDQEELLMTTPTTGTTQDEHEDRLLYESKTASKWDNITGSETPADLMAQMGYSHRGVVMEEEMGTVMPMPELTDAGP